MSTLDRRGATESLAYRTPEGASTPRPAPSTGTRRCPWPGPHWR